MLELVLTVCSLVQGASCHRLRIPLRENTQLMGCVIAAQVEGAKWMSSHPNYYVSRATCAPLRKSLVGASSHGEAKRLSLISK